MVHPHTQQQFINEEIGYGVVATRLIPRGTITWVRDAFDQVISAVKVERIAPIYRDIVVKYCFVDAKGDFVLCWDLARYVNHSCDPNCRSAGYDFELTVRDIQPGEELTDDYGSLNPEYDFTCRCGSALCRKQIRPGDLLRYADVWDRAVEEPFRLISKLPQPLWPLIEEKDVITAVLAHGLPIASCRKTITEVQCPHWRGREYRDRCEMPWKGNDSRRGGRTVCKHRPRYGIVRNLSTWVSWRSCSAS